MKIFRGVIGNKLSKYSRGFCDFVDSRIAGKNPTDNGNIYSSANYGALTVNPNNYPEDTGAAFVRNTNCWGYDVMDQLTAISVYDGYWWTDGRNNNRMTLITPRHVLANRHTVGENGLGGSMSGVFYSNRPKAWVDMSNVIYSAMPLYWIDLTGDGCLLVLDKDISTNVYNLPLAPSNLPSLITTKDINYGIPLINTDQHNSLSIIEMARGNPPPTSIGTTVPYMYWNSPIHTLRSPFYPHTIHGGDSSCPVMIGYEDEISLLSGFYGAGNGPAYYLTESIVNAGILALDAATGVSTGYTVRMSVY